MSNLQIKGIDEDLYAQIKEMANEENRSLSQQILYLAKEYLAKRKKIRTAKPPAQVLLELSGSWADDRKAEEIIKELRKSRRNSQKLVKGW
jgi:hypothetical protein